MCAQACLTLVRDEEGNLIDQIDVRYMEPSKFSSMRNIMPPKTVFLIRHAESAENALMQGVARSWAAITQLSLPTLSDVKGGMELASAMVTGATDECALSSNGESQVAEVRKLLLEDQETLKTFKTEPLIIACSPMLRARLTCDGLFKGIISPSVETIQLDCLREIVPVDYVAPTRWANAKNRLLEFEKWVAQRNEPNVVVVGHSHYFRHMLGVDFKFSNCEIWKVKFFPEAVESADAHQKWSGLERICGSSTAKATFGAEGPGAWKAGDEPKEKA